MSQQHALAFVTRASQEPQLLQQILTATGPLNLAGMADIGKVTSDQYTAAAAIGRQEGYDIDTADLERALNEFTSAHPDQLVNRELSDVELDLVAGGNGNNKQNPL